MMKKVIFAALVLIIGLWSCSGSDEIETSSDGYVNVTIGTQSGNPKSIVAPGGATSWNIDDQVRILDVDGVDQLFSYAAETPKSSAEFTGRLKSGQGNQVYRAYYIPKKAETTLKNGHILVIERDNLVITEDGITNNSAIFGSYCPMVAMPFKFDAEDKTASKLVQFYHLASMIEGRVSLRNPQDLEYLNRIINRVVFVVEAIGSTPFYKKIEFDLNLLSPTSSVEDLNECILGVGEKTNIISTTMNMQERTIKDLMDEYKLLGSFAIPIFAHPTEDAFNYKASICFYDLAGVLQLKLEGSASASKLNPAGLNILNFDYKKIVE
ncbi:hypothetical protein JGH11_11515 [Dysgonomonas sp. Marseille-P4677]|uniref:hypothetical protein n=1 Tax=Dysgonomonas sp. Marseille-P4677 TaxID=2364790 RepID=UPI0019117559|nr:hypothetical protein [Dysgonomonas sp. Marseille-P4677]MBK5721500.1 hypothetical protein [Dysgonomonas sp. Marseille-P4677]